MTPALRPIRDQLRHELSESLNIIEDIVAGALDHIAEEAVAWGADETHDFAIDHVAVKAVDRIRRELDRVADRTLRLVGVMEGLR
jgi:hypothetical protein